MSPQAALESPVFRFYLAVAAGLLVVAGAALALLKWGLHKDVDHAWRAYRGWLLMVPLGLGCIFLGRAVAITLYLGIIATGIVSLVKNPNEDHPGWYGLFMALPVYVIALILLIPILRNRSQGQLQMIALAMVGFVYFGWMFGHLIFLSNSVHAYSYVLYVLFAVELNDVAAYTFGKLFGRHQLRSNISPKKTWEGSLGAFLVSMALPWALRFTFPHFGVSECLLAGLIVGIGGQLGDLAISVIKRDLGIKDMGATIPGHGGILDRIDSIIYVAPLFFHMVRYFHDLY